MAHDRDEAAERQVKAMLMQMVQRGGAKELDRLRAAAQLSLDRSLALGERKELLEVKEEMIRFLGTMHATAAQGRSQRSSS